MTEEEMVRRVKQAFEDPNEYRAVFKCVAVTDEIWDLPKEQRNALAASEIWIEVAERYEETMERLSWGQRRADEIVLQGVSWYTPKARR
jgi:hypothetical protein